MGAIGHIATTEIRHSLQTVLAGASVSAKHATSILMSVSASRLRTFLGAPAHYINTTTIRQANLLLLLTKLPLE